MQTKLRVLSLVFVAGLLWTSPTLAAKQETGKAKPKKAVPAHRYTGVASWYGVRHQGRKMANGEKFDRRKLTAACWFLPLGTIVRVVNLKNGNAVDVRIADRGPNHRLHRVIDLSEAAATQLGFIEDGLTSVFLSPIVSVAPEPADLSAQLIEPFPGAASQQVTALNFVPQGPLH